MRERILTFLSDIVHWRVNSARIEELERQLAEIEDYAIHCQIGGYAPKHSPAYDRYVKIEEMASKDWPQQQEWIIT